VKNYSLYDTTQLLSLIADNDNGAFTEIYNRFWKKLFAIAYNRLREVSTAEDIVHDVFASLWANRQNAAILSLENYLATATKYMVFAAIKRRMQEKVYTRASAYTEPLFEIPVESAVHYRRILEIIKTEVDRLPERCRLVFQYSRDKGMPVKQIARELNISPKTVENQLTKAIRQLRLVTKTFLHMLAPFFCSFFF
jgi:RNA polymerase sigma-70 factor (family 1)